MPPAKIAFDSSDEDEKPYPLRSLHRKVHVEPEFPFEVDELLSDADDDLEPVPQPPPRPSASRRDKRDDKSEQERRQERRPKREADKEEKIQDG